MAADPTRIAALVLAATAPVLAQQKPPQKAFVDPAPPVVREFEATARPEPKAYDGLVHGTKPKPLNEGAKTFDWPTFLGPDQKNHCKETNLLFDWPEGGPRMVWSMRRGEGYAAPIIHRDRLVFTHRVGNAIHVDCVHAVNGKRFWRRSFPTRYDDRYIDNDGPRSTPVTDGEHVWVHGLQGHLRCFELATGRTRWERDLHKELDTSDDFFGVCSSPLLWNDLLIQQLGATDGPVAAAFDKSTGRLVWGAGTKWGPSCCSPVIGKVHGKDRAFILAGGDSRPPTGGLLVVDPKTGKIDFEHEFRSKLYLSVTSCCPLVLDNHAYLTNSYGVGSEMLKLAADGSYTSAWKNRRVAIQFSNPIEKDGHIYVIDGKSGRAGAIVCLSPKTGKVLNRTELNWDETLVSGGEKVPYNASIGEGSLLVADGKVLCVGDVGHLLWLDVSPQGTKVLQRSWLFKGHESWTPPVISRGLLYVCQNNDEQYGSQKRRLICYDFRR